MQPAVAAQSAAKPTRPLSPRIQRLFGAVQVPAGFDYKQALAFAVTAEAEPAIEAIVTHAPKGFAAAPALPVLTSPAALARLVG